MDVTPINWRNWVEGDVYCGGPVMHQREWRRLRKRLARAARREWRQDRTRRKDKVGVTDGYRPYRDQQRLYAQNMNPATGQPYPGHPLTAVPGTSNHGKGKAADCKYRGGNVGDTMRDSLRAMGLCLPVPGESWHTEIGNVWNA